MNDKLAITLLELISKKTNCESALSTVRSELLTRGTLGQLNTSDLRQRLQNLQSTFSISEGSHEIPYVRIEVKVELCPVKTQCSKSTCGYLHICKYFLLSNSCRRKVCEYGHSLDTPHNRKVLSQFWMDQLPVEDVRNIFRCIRNRTYQTTPRICRNFQTGCCDESQRKCPFLHLCPNYINESCTMPVCDGHDVLDKRVAITLERYGIDMKRSEEEILGDLRALELCQSAVSGYRSEPVLAHINQERNIRGTSWGRGSGTGRGRLGGRGGRGNFGRIPQKSCMQPWDGEICMEHFQNCPRKGKCDKHHKKRIYQWQCLLQDEEEQTWRDFDDTTNIQLEKTFGDPQESQCLIAFRKGNIVTINFKTMTGCSKQTQMSVRRLTTPSSDSPKVEPERYRWSTFWRWFWEDEDGVWIEYDVMEPDIRHRLEKAFIDNPVGQLQLQISGNIYDIHFGSMTQTNITTSTKRRVTRRPRFFTETEFETRVDPRLLKPLSPKEWSTVYTDMDELAKHYKREMVSETSEEYLRVESLFRNTIPSGKVIIALERIENGELWIRFDAQRERMKRKAGKNVDERQLLHGTTDASTEAICRQGFEFRNSGDRFGCRYGMGSYFARDAKYSHCYTDQKTDIKKMFVAQVLVGEFTVGASDYKRPPPRNASDPYELFDSCVNDELDPQIFVIFSLDQAYPQYLITYIDTAVWY
ncbi:protein mono-ADP-ribosyltransferase PARP12-like [Haliotis asinina]|uniref:protein mono-ADP-ribosyltransferase PARP12-like n=1 Tax=Haliotis asinina TaxID=109174 RepID=UPI003531D1ED